MDPVQDMLGRINSATKYPSIETYHKLSQGKLTPEVQVSLDGEEVIVTEKVDGTNARLIYFALDPFYSDDPGRIPSAPTRYLVGSREELIYASGDLIINPIQSIVEGVQGLARAVVNGPYYGGVFVFFGEVYGGRGITQASKFYSKDGQIGFRLFDAIEFTPKHFREVTSKSREEIARWREHGGQPFVSEYRLEQLADMLKVELTPRLPASVPPTGVSETHEWLKAVLKEGSCVLLGEPGKGKPEGVVVRTRDRSKIAKIRFEDYERAERSH